MALEDAGRDDLQPDPAAEAFEALRADLLARLDALTAELKAPDYSPTLAAIVQTLQAIERHPALRYTPQGFAQEMRAGSDVVRQQAERELYGVGQQLNLAVKDLTNLAAGVRGRHEQNRLLAIALAAGVGLGALVAGCLCGLLWR